jgi:hypothetical protein
MFQGLSLDQAPPYKIPLQFYITATLYLFAFSLLFASKALSFESRFAYDSIALTHLLTLGFFTHIMFGSMFQMIPVMLGLAYKNVVGNANITYYTLNGGIVLFIYGFLTQKIPFLHAGASLLLLSFLYFSFLSLKTLFHSENKNFLLKTFATSFFLLGLGALFGFFALLGHQGVISSAYFGDLHIAFMLFGWIFLLINAVSYKIIPMFFVAKEFPKQIKNSYYILVTLLLILFAILRENDFLFLSNILLLFLNICTVMFALYTVFILTKRKRKRKDISVNLWYFSMINLSIAAVLLSVKLFIEYPYLDIAIGFFALFGGIYALINAMLYKIIPFLTWFHLNSNMIFDAEMSQVIEKKSMQKQINFFYLAYFFLLISIFWRYFALIGAVFFGISALILFKNTFYAYKYYKKHIQAIEHVNNG